MMNQWLVLFKREFWEHRGSMMILPLVMSSFLILLALLVSFMVTFGSEQIVIESDFEWSQERRDGSGWYESEDEVDGVHEGRLRLRPGEGMIKEKMLRELEYFAGRSDARKQKVVQDSLNSVALPMFLVMWGVIFFYLLASLHDDRKDRSILFWKSLPVSDLNTVLSKLLTAMLIVPFIVIVCIMIVQVSALIIVSFTTLDADISIWQTFWAPANLISLWATFFVKMLFLNLWVLPFFGWLILVSASARTNPLSWAIGLPIGVVILAKVGLLGSGWTQWMIDHGLVPLEFMAEPRLNGSLLWQNLLSLEMLSALLVGGAMIAGAVIMRGRSEEL